MKKEYSLAPPDERFEYCISDERRFEAISRIFQKTADETYNDIAADLKMDLKTLRKIRRDPETQRVIAKFGKQIIGDKVLEIIEDVDDLRKNTTDERLKFDISKFFLALSGVTANEQVTARHGGGDIHTTNVLIDGGGMSMDVLGKMSEAIMSARKDVTET